MCPTQSESSIDHVNSPMKHYVITSLTWHLEQESLYTRLKYIQSYVKHSIHGKMYALVHVASKVCSPAAILLRREVAPPKRMRFSTSLETCVQALDDYRSRLFRLCVHPLIEKNVGDFVVLD